MTIAKFRENKALYVECQKEAGQFTTAYWRLRKLKKCIRDGDYITGQTHVDVLEGELKDMAQLLLDTCKGDTDPIPTANFVDPKETTDKLKEDNEKLKKEIVVMNKELNELKQHMGDLEKELDEREASAEITVSNTDKEEIERLQTEITNLENDLKIHTDETKNIRLELHDCQQDNDFRIKVIDEQSEKILKLEEQTANIQTVPSAELARLQNEVAELTKVRNTLTYDLEQAKFDDAFNVEKINKLLDQLHKAQSDHVDFNEALRALVLGRVLPPEKEEVLPLTEKEIQLLQQFITECDNVQNEASTIQHLVGSKKQQGPILQERNVSIDDYGHIKTENSELYWHCMIMAYLDNLVSHSVQATQGAKLLAEKFLQNAKNN